jgi:hypothetical protein
MVNVNRAHCKFYIICAAGLYNKIGADLEITFNGTSTIRDVCKRVSRLTICSFSVGTFPGAALLISLPPLLLSYREEEAPNRDLTTRLVFRRPCYKLVINLTE